MDILVPTTFQSERILSSLAIFNSLEVHDLKLKII